MKKIKINLCILAGVVLIFSAVYITGDSYYKSLLEQEGKEASELQVYRYKFDMIVDNPESSFWQAVWESASRQAMQNDALLELRGLGRNMEYEKADFMNMSIASGADGIILEYNGEHDIEEKINEAVENGIPVITIMNDAVHSKRQSFVGISEYQLGVAYGQQVAEYVDKNTENILILMKWNMDDMDQSQIYTQISNAVQEKIPENSNVRITGQNLLTAGTFETEEAVTDIFQNKEDIPDILVCMDEETTECARQAVIDFNLAGEVKIIGYYTSEEILTAVEKGVISVTCDINTEQLGTYSVEALTEYMKCGRTSSYYNVDLDFLGKTDVERLRRRENYEAVSME